MKSLIPRNIPGRNCLEMSLENILTFMNYELPVYKQLSFTYAFDSKEMGRFYSGFLSLKEELKWINNIVIQINEATDPLTFISSVKELLNEDIPTVIFVNPFFLEYSNNYQRRSVPHTITLVGYIENDYYIIDDVQNFQDKISLDELIEAASKAKYKYSYLYVPKKQILRDTSELDILDVIRKNTASIKGNLSKNNPRIPTELQTITGIKSIEKFIEDCKLLLTKIYQHENKNLLLDEIYRGVYGISNQHFMYSEFLYKNKHLIPINLSQITNSLNFLSQEWKIVAIMFMKSSYRNIKDLDKSIVRKMEEIKYLEEELIQKSEEFLYNHA